MLLECVQLQTSGFQMMGPFLYGLRVNILIFLIYFYYLKYFQTKLINQNAEMKTRSIETSENRSDIFNVWVPRKYLF